MKRLLVLLALLAVAGTAIATPLLHVRVTDKEAWHELHTAGFDVLSTSPEMLEQGIVPVVGWPEDIPRLQAAGFSYYVEQQDMESFYRSRLNYELDDMGGYPTVSEIEDWYDEFLADYPDIVSEKDTIGYTLEDRAIWAFKMSDNPDEDEDEPEIFLNAAIHAREVITPMVLQNFCELLAEGYGSDDRITNIVDEREIYFVMVVNPDGYTYNEENDPNGGGMWRKNKRRINNVLYGVDLNRNFSYQWGYDNNGSSPQPSSATYRGDSAASEPATQAIIEYTNSRNFVSCINYHSYSDIAIHPYGYDSAALPDDLEIYTLLGEYILETLNWPLGNAGNLLYEVNGDAVDWMEGGADYNIFAYVFEVGSQSDGFWPATHRIVPLTTAQEEPLLRFCEMSGNLNGLYPPLAPTVTVDDTVSGEFPILWETLGEHPGGIEAVSYDLEMLQGEIDTADAEVYSNWAHDGFHRTATHTYNGTYSYYSGNGNQLNNTMTAEHPYLVQEDDILRMWMDYDIEINYDYALVQASFDGGPFINLEGSETTNYDPHGVNPGNGITGSSGDWVEATFPLDEYAGQSMILRLAYVTDTYVSEPGIWVDDITPFRGFSESEMLVESTPDTFFVLDHHVDPGDQDTLFFRARAWDDQDRVSAWSNSARTLVLPTDAAPERETGMPVEFAVNSITPNPFNASANVSVTLPGMSRVTVQVFDLLGREVDRLDMGNLAGGTRALHLDGRAWASGTYFVRVQALQNDGALHSALRKAVLLK
ncbi:T9SS type A sorting domain-containing protein [bacterium]|nr:T9SS type A sorting domain-containing protein [bacterium]